jgi:hypothetical protein
MKPILSVFLLLLMVAGCATFSLKDEERGFTTVINLINDDHSDTLASISTVPFLFDGEILLVKQDVEVLWKNAIAAGFELPKPQIVDIEPAKPDMASIFSDSKEVAVFFKKYLPKNAVFASVKSDNGEYLFILGERISGVPRIVAFKGPVQ